MSYYDGWTEQIAIELGEIDERLRISNRLKTIELLAALAKVQDPLVADKLAGELEGFSGTEGEWMNKMVVLCFGPPRHTTERLNDSLDPTSDAEPPEVIDEV